MKKALFLWTCAALLFAAGCTENEPVPPPPPPPPPDEAIDLSAKGTANCYVVNAAGDYSFDATVMGNGVSTLNAAASKLAPASAGIVWQDTPELLTNVSLKENRVVFTAGEKQGNALIAVYDASEKVLWSWHIWVTDYNPSSGAPKYNGLEWMTRNLGARSGDYDEAGLAKGMAYQWGRKDPFPSGEGWIDRGKITVYDATGAEAPEMFKNEQVAEANNLANAIANPTTYYYGVRVGDEFAPYDWLTTQLEGTNNQLWETQADGGKTLFDPCPPGWRVPRKASWTGLSEGDFAWDDAALGRRHSQLGYYPAMGGRGSANGEWTFVSGSGQYWSSTAADETTVHVLYFLMSYIDVLGKTNRSAGLPVRCVSETQGDPGVDPKPVETIVLDRVTEASYIAFTGADASCNYYIGLSNVPFEVNDSGEQMPTEPGMIMYLDMFGAPSADEDAAILPEGTYLLNDTKTSLTSNSQYTWARELLEDGSVDYIKPTSGTIKVTHKDNGYLIDCDFMLPDGNPFKLKYEGELTFTNRSTGPIVPLIEEPVDVTFTEVTATWEYSNEKADRFTIDLLNGKMSGKDLTEGSLIRLDLLSKPLSVKGENILIEPGTYQISNDYETPMTFSGGGVISMMGVPYFYGSYLVQITDKERYGYAATGTVEVKRTGDQYEFVVDVQTPEGVSVKGTYPMGDVTFVDNSPYEPAGPWKSILREDKTILFTETDETLCRIWTYNTSWDEELPVTEFEIQVDNQTKNETFQLLVAATKGATTPAGTYTAAVDPDNPQPGEFIPGWSQFGAKKATWCYLIYIHTTAEYVGAPATEGTIEIKDLENGEIEVEFELKDDAEPKNTVRSHWSGPVRWIE